VVSHLTTLQSGAGYEPAPGNRQGQRESNVANHFVSAIDQQIRLLSQ
jgi:hypothetical protein